MYMTLHIPVPTDSVTWVSAEAVRRRGPVSSPDKRGTGKEPRDQPEAIGAAGPQDDGQASPETRGRGLIGGLLQRSKALIVRMFPDRQLFVRANDHVRFVALSRRTQLVMAGTGIVLFGWTVVATGFLISLYHSVDLRDTRLARQRMAYDKLVTDVAAYQ